MDFNNPESLKDFAESDSVSDTDTGEKLASKKDSTKRKEKKDKKDKEKGYAALEGESSADEKSKSRSPLKSKKPKSFKFTTTKSKEKREEQKEIDIQNKKRDREKKVDKEKLKIDKGKKVKVVEKPTDIADALPLFGVTLEAAVINGTCHDGIAIPLPVRQCIDYVESQGLNFESVYKVSGTKSKVLQLKKMYNAREPVFLNEYEVPTATSLLKMFFRDLPEPLFTSDLLLRFEEAGAILNAGTREKHLKILIDSLPLLNKTVLGWLVTHLEHITANEKLNKMSRSSISTALSHTLHASPKLLTGLLSHSLALFPDVTLIPYIPPLSGSSLPENAEAIDEELKKQESLLNQIHREMKVGCISKQREEMLWEVQRIITQLKRKMKHLCKDREVECFEKPEESVNIESISSNDLEKSLVEDISKHKPEENLEDNTEACSLSSQLDLPNQLSSQGNSKMDDLSDEEVIETHSTNAHVDGALHYLKLKNEGLLKLQENLVKAIQGEQKEIEVMSLKLQDTKTSTVPPGIHNSENLDNVMELLQKENQILYIKKINLVRNIIEQQELCIDLRSRIKLMENYI